MTSRLNLTVICRNYIVLYVLIQICTKRLKTRHVLSHEAVPTSFKEFKTCKVCSLTTAQLRVNIQKLTKNPSTFGTKELYFQELMNKIRNQMRNKRIL